MHKRSRTLVALAPAIALLTAAHAFAAPPFAVGGDPAVDPSDFRVTVFAQGLDFPIGMQELGDGSLVVGVSRSDGTPGGNQFNSIGELVRLVDADADGVADGPGTLLATGLPGLVTSVKLAGSFAFVASSQIGLARITVLRLGAGPADPYTQEASLDLAFPLPWSHFTLSLEARETAPDSYHVFFNLGSKVSGTATTETVSASGLATGNLAADALHRLTVVDNAGTVTAPSLELVATGLRNAFGAGLEPGTGDLYFADNGFEDPNDPSEPLMTDELDVIRAADLGGPAEDFGFAGHYVEYRTGNIIGSGSLLPEIAFQPLGAAESRGPAALAFAPPAFPAPLAGGLFVGFHGIFNQVGAGNPASPVVFANPATGQYFHFTAGDEPAIGHPDGLLATQDSLFIADLTSVSGFSGFGTGSIYQVRANANPVPTLPLVGLGALALAALAAIHARATIMPS